MKNDQEVNNNLENSTQVSSQDNNTIQTPTRVKVKYTLLGVVVSLLIVSLYVVFSSIQQEDSSQIVNPPESYPSVTSIEATPNTQQFDKRVEISQERKQDFSDLLSDEAYVSLKDSNLVGINCSGVYQRIGPDQSLSSSLRNAGEPEASILKIARDFDEKYDDRFVSAFNSCTTENGLRIMLISENPLLGGGSNFYHYSHLLIIENQSIVSDFSISENTEIETMSCRYPLALTRDNKLYTICAHSGKALVAINVESGSLEVFKMLKLY